ncbi:MAG TPA: GNAT family protein [Pyrinomonadaceae bacterium]
MSVELADGEIIVRPYRPEDIPALFEAARASIPELSVWMPWCHPNYSIEETKSFILSRPEQWAKDAEYGFGVFSREDGRFLGGVGVNFINRVHDMANLGYWVRSSETGRGIASKAARLVAQFGLGQLGFQRIEILAATANIASQRVAEKAGALKEGVLRNRLRLHGQPVDAVLYSLIAEDLSQ